MYGSYWWIKEVSEPPSHSFHSFAPKYLISLFIGHLNPTSLSSVGAQLCLTLWDSLPATHQASLSITNSWSLLKLMSMKSVMPSNHLILSHSLLLPSIFPSIRVFSNESALYIRWPKYCSFSISPHSAYSGLVSFKIDWFDLLAVQGTLVLYFPQWEIRNKE